MLVQLASHRRIADLWLICIPSLLRRVAATLGELGPVEVAELVARGEITDDGHWPSLTVSFHRWCQTQTPLSRHNGQRSHHAGERKDFRQISAQARCTNPSRTSARRS
jgi:hypothetical protein